jgi:hypothetical protein
MLALEQTKTFSWSGALLAGQPHNLEESWDLHKLLTTSVGRSRLELV